MHITQSPAYRNAFIQYLRKGTPIELSLKAAQNEHPTPYYIWRTSGDSKVRSSHAANNGKIFAWDNPPPTGHPSEEYNCRCWAEPYYGYVDGLIEGGLDLISNAVMALLNYFRNELATSTHWENRHMVAHFYVGGGKAVTLSEIGQLDAIRKYYEVNYLPRFVMQLQDRTRMSRDGILTDGFSQSYSFREVLFSHGGASIHGYFKGNIFTVEGNRILQGYAVFEFSDVFTDPLDLLESVLKMWNNISGLPLIQSRDIPSVIHKLVEVGGLAYQITGRWGMELKLSI